MKNLRLPVFILVSLSALLSFYNDQLLADAITMKSDVGITFTSSDTENVLNHSDKIPQLGEFSIGFLTLLGLFLLVCVVYFQWRKLRKKVTK